MQKWHTVVQSTKLLTKGDIPHVVPDHGRTEKHGKGRESSGVTSYGVWMTVSDLCGFGSDWIGMDQIGSDSMDGVNLCVDGHIWSHLLHETVD